MEIILVGEEINANVYEEITDHCNYDCSSYR